MRLDFIKTFTTKDYMQKVTETMMRSIFFSLLLFSLIACRKDDITEGLPDNTINKIFIDKSGIKWIATNKGIVSFDGNAFVTCTNAYLTDKIIADLAFESENNKLWIATISGVAVSDFASGNIENPTGYDVQNGLLSNNVKAVGVGDSGKYYFGTATGLSILHNNIWSSFSGKTEYENNEILNTYEISDIANTTNGWVFVSTLGGGVSRFKYEIDAISGATTYNSAWAPGIGSDSVNTVIVVDDTCQWFGTNKGAGFHTSHLTKKNWFYYSAKDGLICDTVLAIAKDKKGNVWFGTPKGVSKFDGKNTWTTYVKQDGLIDNKINTIAIDIDNSVWFGTDKGISHFIENKWTNYSK